jgi:hypothetical protein
LRNITKIIIEFLLIPPFKLKSKISSQFFDSLEKHEKLVFDKINASLNKQDFNPNNEQKSPEIASAGLFKPKSSFLRNSAFKPTEYKESNSPLNHLHESLVPPGSPFLEKRNLLSPGVHSPLRALFPALFKASESSSPSQSGNSSISSPTTGSPMLRGMSAMLKKPMLKDGDETRILLKMIRFV